VRIEDIDKAKELADRLKEVDAIRMSYDASPFRVGFSIIRGQENPIYVTMSERQVGKILISASVELEEQLEALGVWTHQR
jgi:hypothetical protein